MTRVVLLVVLRRVLRLGILMPVVVGVLLLLLDAHGIVGRSHGDSLASSRLPPDALFVASARFDDDAVETWRRRKVRLDEEITRRSWCEISCESHMCEGGVGGGSLLLMNNTCHSHARGSSVLTNFANVDEEVTGKVVVVNGNDILELLHLFPLGLLLLHRHRIPWLRERRRISHFHLYNP